MAMGHLAAMQIRPKQYLCKSEENVEILRQKVTNSDDSRLPLQHYK